MHTFIEINTWYKNKQTNGNCIQMQSFYNNSYKKKI